MEAHLSLRSRLFNSDPKLEAAAVSAPAHIIPGAVGPHVAKIQRALIRLDGADIDPGELENARYGPSTANAVLSYKRKRNIINRSYQTQADNIVGVMTIASMDNELAQKDLVPVVVHSVKCKGVRPAASKA
jgi:peptidoglycan hydrolase-like protein with peptidoglycan-binding domain